MANEILAKFQLRFLMTPVVFRVEASDSLVKVKDELAKHNVRHLPVLSEGKIVGLVSDRDVSLVVSLAKHITDEDSLTAVDVCTPDPYVVDIEEPIEKVLSYMGKSRIGSALITENGELAGIFTTTDACVVCGDLVSRLREEQ